MIRTILGIDAAWTAAEPSGIALVQRSGSIWRCLAVAPSCDAFVGLGDGTPVDRSARPVGSAPDVASLLCAARTLSRSNIDLVTIDMPVSTVAITGRRAAENLVSRQFSARHCGAHAPNPDRPGVLGATLTQALVGEHFPVATSATTPGTAQHLLEAYPHPALLALLNRPMRVPYKQSKAAKYWPGASKHDRIVSLLTEYRAIAAALAEAFSDHAVHLPAAVTQLDTLKRYEDALDALVCCWVGVLYADCQATALGDDTAAIWCPTASVNDLPAIPSRRRSKPTLPSSKRD